MSHFNKTRSSLKPQTGNTCFCSAPSKSGQPDSRQGQGASLDPGFLICWPEKWLFTHSTGLIDWSAFSKPLRQRSKWRTRRRMDSGSDFSSKDEHGTRQKSPLWPPHPPSLRGEETQKPPAKLTETLKNVPSRPRMRWVGGNFQVCRLSPWCFPFTLHVSCHETHLPRKSARSLRVPP